MLSSPLSKDSSCNTEDSGNTAALDSSLFFALGNQNCQHNFHANTFSTVVTKLMSKIKLLLTSQYTRFIKSNFNTMSGCRVDNIQKTFMPPLCKFLRNNLNENIFIKNFAQSLLGRCGLGSI